MSDEAHFEVTATGLHVEWWLALCSAAFRAAGASTEPRRQLFERGTSSLTVEPGTVSCAVTARGADSDAAASISVPTLRPSKVEALATAAAAAPLRLVALIDGDLPWDAPLPGTDGEWRTLGFLPRPGAVTWECSCGRAGPPCVHVVRLAGYFAGLLAVEPTALLTLLGSDRDALAALAIKRTGLGTGTADSFDVAVPAWPENSGTWSAQEPPAWVATPHFVEPPPISSGIDPDDLRRAAWDGAERARLAMSAGINPFTCDPDGGSATGRSGGRNRAANITEDNAPRDAGGANSGIVPGTGKPGTGNGRSGSDAKSGEGSADLIRRVALLAEDSSGRTRRTPAELTLALSEISDRTGIEIEQLQRFVEVWNISEAVTPALLGPPFEPSATASAAIASLVDSGWHQHGNRLISPDPRVEWRCDSAAVWWVGSTDREGRWKPECVAVMDVDGDY